MKCFSFSCKDLTDASVYYIVLEQIENLHSYFSAFNRGRVDEAKHQTLLHAVKYYNVNKDHMEPYLKKLAQTILKPKDLAIPCDFMEKTYADSLVIENKAIEMVEVLSDCTDLLDEVYKLALGYLSSFKVLCESLETRSPAKHIFPKGFTNSCLSLISRYDNFNNVCLKIYHDNLDMFNNFNEFRQEGTYTINTCWREADYTLIGRKVSKRVSMLDCSGYPIKNPDLEPFYLSSTLGEKGIYTVDYTEALETMRTFIYSDSSNVMKFVLGDHYVIRTLGGSISVLDVPLRNALKLCKDEILTNLLIDLSARHFPTGLENMYFLMDLDSNRLPLRRVVNGVLLDFSLVPYKLYD